MRLVKDLRYNLEKAHAMRRLATPTGRPAVVFTMGETGAAPVVHALRAQLDRPVFHIHRLNYGSVSAAEGRCRRTEPTARPRDLWESEYLLRRLPTREEPWDVVTIVREPIAQAVSAHSRATSETIDLTTNTAVDALTRIFEDQTDFRNPLRWFDREFEPGLDVCVYEHDFDPVQGYAFIETPAVRVLMLRSENLGVAPEALAEFFRLLDPVAISAGAAQTHGCAHVSGEFAGNAAIPESILDRAYRSRYAKHFYGPAELAEYRQAWTRSGQLH